MLAMKTSIFHSQYFPCAAAWPVEFVAAQRREQLLSAASRGSGAASRGALFRVAARGAVAMQRTIAAPLGARASSGDGGKLSRRRTATSQHQGDVLSAGSEGSEHRRVSEPNAAGAMRDTPLRSGDPGHMALAPHLARSSLPVATQLCSSLPVATQDAI